MADAPNPVATPVTVLKGVGPQLQERLARLGLRTLQDLAFHLPYRYQDRTRVTRIGALVLHQDAVVEGIVCVCDIAFGRRRSLVCRIQDGTGTLTLRFYHFNAAQKKNLAAGVRLRCYGEVRRGVSGFELYHPEYRIVTDAGADSAGDLRTTLTPVYPTTEGLTQVRLRALIDQALQKLTPADLVDLLPTTDGIHLYDRLRTLHHPPPDTGLARLMAGEHPFQQHLAFEELVAHHLGLMALRDSIRQRNATALPVQSHAQQQFIDQLPYTLTAAQRRVSEEIGRDLSSTHPMLRLLQGDVGSGKTLVAALAALQAIHNGKQVALMAPTEILAEQHYKTFHHWFAPLGISSVLLTGRLGAQQRKQPLQDIAEGRVSLVIGTHALFQKSVNYRDLALVIIDEQHRFGVQQRLALSDKARVHGFEPHQLTLTATPIPRTLAMSLYADMDYSVIDELPPHRKPVNTALIDNQRRAEIIERIRTVCQRGVQAYWVCTLIEPPEDDSDLEKWQCEAAEKTCALLQQQLPELRIALIHGQLKPQEKTSLMEQFQSGEIQLLVATTVIEVGVDVPNASLMIIENPERLGLAQLHQLRGRVGRGEAESHCVLLYQSPLSALGRERLTLLREHHDGFVIAEKDLALRGPGELLGIRQTGEVRFRVADLQRDAARLPQVLEYARQLSRDNPDRAEALVQRWFGSRQVYGQT